MDRPALILIVGTGVHLRSNGIDGTTTRIVTTEQADPSFAFADGMNPFRDTDWMAQRRIAFRDLTGQFYTDILDDVQVLIDRGRGAIRLATDGHSIRVFVRRASDYLIGGTYEVPSASAAPSGSSSRMPATPSRSCRTAAIARISTPCSPIACRSMR